MVSSHRRSGSAAGFVSVPQDVQGGWESLASSHIDEPVDRWQAPRAGRSITADANGYPFRHSGDKPARPPQPSFGGSGPPSCRCGHFRRPGTGHRRTVRPVSSASASRASARLAPDPLSAGSQPTLWGHASRVPGRGWRGTPPLRSPEGPRSGGVRGRGAHPPNPLAALAAALGGLPAGYLVGSDPQGRGHTAQAGAFCRANLAHDSTCAGKIAERQKKPCRFRRIRPVRYNPIILCCQHRPRLPKQTLSAVWRGNPDPLQYPTRWRIRPFTPLHCTAAKSPAITVRENESLAITPGFRPHYKVVVVFLMQRSRDPGGWVNRCVNVSGGVFPLLG